MIGSLHVSTNALRHNARVLRDLAGPAQAAFVVKGNAYGHGLVETARAIEALAARLCVYTLEEGLALRAAGIAAPVLVLGPVPLDALDDALAADLELTLWDAASFAQRLCACARGREIQARVHVKVNTDLNRLGLETRGLPAAIESLLAMPDLRVAGIFSHLAAAEEMDSPYTMHQLRAFEGALARVRPLLTERGAAPLAHIAASAAAMLWPQTRLDMVRFGIALYGLWPSPQTREALGANAPDLRPALAYRSQIVAVRTVAAGASIGYGRSFHAPREMPVGVVAAGYADGVPRALSNRGAFLVNGAVCPIVGRVAMNMTQIDLTRAPGARPGATVTLLGRDGDAEVRADDWASWCDTINYEIVTRLPAELRREYPDEKER